MLTNGETPDLALMLAQIARQGMLDSPNAADTPAWAYCYKNCTYESARDLLEHGKECPQNATMRYHLVEYSKLWDKSNAANHVMRAISLARDSPVGKDAKLALQGLV